ncbi:hypothetical protein MOSE0_K08548 [Monosporozyma servazzii]
MNNNNQTSNNDLLSYSIDQTLDHLANNANRIPFGISQVEQSLLNNAPTPPSVKHETRSTLNKDTTPNNNNEIPVTTKSYNDNEAPASSLTPSEKLLKLNNSMERNQSIGTLWNQLFNIPISLDKEKKIQQALDFMDAENKAYQTNKNVTKHSFRQIAQFFSVPKSTLYDRTKLKQNGKSITTPVVKENKCFKTDDDVESSSSSCNEVHRNSTIPPVLAKTDSNNKDNTTESESLTSISLTPIDNVNSSTFRSSSIVSDQSSINGKADIITDKKTKKRVGKPSDSRYKRYEVQMKLSVSKEFEILNELRLISHAYGDIISKNQMDEYIKGHVDSKIQLGKTWLRGFLKRHKDHIIYGNDNCYNTIPIELMKEVTGSPQCLINCIVDEIHYRLTHNKKESQHVYIICLLPLSEFGVNKNSITICLDVSVDEGTVKFVVPPRLLMYSSQTTTSNKSDEYEDHWSIKEDYNHSKVTCLNNGINRMVNACVKRHQNQNPESNTYNSKPLIILEGFTQAFHWDINLCENILSVCDFITIPWHAHIFRDILFHHFQHKLFQTMKDLCSTLNDDKSCHEYNIGIDEYIPSFSQNVFAIFSNEFLEEKQNDDEHSNDICLTGRKAKINEPLNLSNLAVGEWNILSVTEVHRHDSSVDGNDHNSVVTANDNGNGNGSIVDKNIAPALGSPMDLAQLSDINFNGFTQYDQSHNTNASWEELMALISNNEQHLYGQLNHSKDKELLKAIFERVKRSPPN